MKLFEIECRGAYFEDAEDNACLTFRLPYEDQKWHWGSKLSKGKWTEDNYAPVDLVPCGLGALGYRALLDRFREFYFDVGLPKVGKIRSAKLETKKTFPVNFYERHQKPRKDGPEFRPKPSSIYIMQVNRGWIIENGQRTNELEIVHL